MSITTAASSAACQRASNAYAARRVAIMSRKNGGLRAEGWSPPGRRQRRISVGRNEAQDGHGHVPPLRTTMSTIAMKEDLLTSTSMEARQALAAGLCPT